jgi:AcrR family transcriptional regulator
VLRAGVELTQREGLGAVTMRRLATELGTFPAVIYHHVGDKDEVHDAISDWVVAQFTVPAVDMAWQDWFRELLVDGRRVLRANPGVARRLMLRGATVPSALRIVDLGVALLARSGFGDEAPAAYSLLLIYGCQYVAMEDELPEHARARMAMRELFTSFRDDATRPGLAQAGAAFPAITGDDLFAYGLERVLDGLEVRRRQLAAER